MKRTFTKLLALVGLALGATTAHAADYYWIYGNCWGKTDWINSPSSMTQSGSKYYLYTNTIQSGNFGIKKTSDSNGSTQTGWYSSSASDTTIKPGEKMGTTTSGGDFWLPGNYVAAYTIVFNGSTELIFAPELYIFKDDGGWNLDSNEMLTYSVANNNYTGTFSINNASGGYFTLGANKGSWDKINNLRFSCKGDVTPSFTSSNTYSGDVTLGGGGAFKLPKGEYNLTLDLSTKKITIEKTSAAIYVVGDGEGLNWDLPGMKVEEDENGNYTFTVNNLSKFKFSKNNSDDWNGTGKFNDGAYKTVKAFSDAVSSDEGETLDLENNGDDQLVPWTGEYTITISGDFKTMTAMTKTPRPAPYLLVGNSSNAADFSKIEKTDDCKFEVTEDSNISKLRYTFTEPGTYYIMLHDGVIKGSEDKNQPELDINNFENYLYFDNTQGEGTPLSLTISEPTTIFFRYYKEYKKDGVLRSCLFAQAYPADRDQLHIFGHINNKYWDNKNYEVIERTEFGVYRVNNVDISGRWNQADVDLNKDRVLNGDSGNENYVAFYDDLREDNPGYKLGATTENQLVYQNEKGEVRESESETYPLQYVDETSHNNFHVAKGIYDIEIDLNKMTVTFIKKHPATKEEKLPAEFVWFQGYNTYDKNGKSDGGATVTQDQNSITIFPEDNHILQVGIEDDPDHIVARQVTYKVWFKAEVPALLRRYEAPSKDGYAEVDGVSIDEQNTEEAHPDAIYYIYGSSNENDNHLIKLNQPGDYIIEADLHEKANNVDNYQIPDTNSLKVTLVGSNVGTGVEGIETEAEDGAVYYNMQGVRVANPAAGEIYIKVAGGNSVKIVK